MQITTGYENRRARIEIVPLIDVVFLLLVFFIYAMLSMSVYRGLEVNLPRAVEGARQDTVVVVSLDKHGLMRIDERVVAMDAAVQEVARRAGQHGASVLIRADRAAELGTAVELLSRIKAAGLMKVAFQVEDP